MMLIFFFLITGNAFAVCDSPISRTNVGASTVLTSTRYNADLNTAYNRANNLPGDCVTDGTITGAKLVNGSITTVKIPDGAITLAKVASGVVPEAGRPLRVSGFTGTGTWTKQSDVGSILVQVVGGGGSAHGTSSSNGGQSSFGTHCIAGGGLKASSSTTGGAGGTASSGQINLQGGSGENSYDTSAASGGASFLGPRGSGGHGQSVAGGGAGAFCMKVITAADLTSTVSVTIGAGGTVSGGGIANGTAGAVIIYEYSK